MCNLLGFILKKMLFKVPSNENPVFETVISLYVFSLYTRKHEENRAENTMDELHWNLGTNPVN